MEDSDMLAFTYRIRKIIRDMQHTVLSTPQAQSKQNALVESLKNVCEQIEQDFS